ncbi:MAG TPA: hypothetical protein VJM81_08280 [Rhizorhapis sp.]|nr:hypothetical protein [Rhizorhapis sp.]
MTRTLKCGLALSGGGMRGAWAEERHPVLQRLYRLDPGLIGRFYAGRSTMADRLPILSCKAAPVPAGRALAALGEKAA